MGLAVGQRTAAEAWTAASTLAVAAPEAALAVGMTEVAGAAPVASAQVIAPAAVVAPPAAPASGRQIAVGTAEVAAGDSGKGSSAPVFAAEADSVAGSSTRHLGPR